MLVQSEQAYIPEELTQRSALAAQHLPYFLPDGLVMIERDEGRTQHDEKTGKRVPCDTVKLFADAVVGRCARCSKPMRLFRSVLAPA